MKKESQDPDSSSLDESQTTNQIDNVDDTNLHENQSEGTKESARVDEIKR